MTEKCLYCRKIKTHPAVTSVFSISLVRAHANSNFKFLNSFALRRLMSCDSVRQLQPLVSVHTVHLPWPGDDSIKLFSAGNSLHSWTTSWGWGNVYNYQVFVLKIEEILRNHDVLNITVHCGTYNREIERESSSTLSALFISISLHEGLNKTICTL